MEVLDGQKVFIASLYPPLLQKGLALRTVAVPAEVVGDLDMAAAISPVLMPAQHCSPADLNGAHDPQIAQSERNRNEGCTF
jgi:hypothetical protein